MPRFVFTFFLLLLVGCQTAGRSPQRTILVNSSQPATPAKAFWVKASRLLQPLMPDRGNNSTELNEHLAAHRSTSDILPISHRSNSLYTAGSIFPSAALSSQTPTSSVLVGETTEKVVLANPNSLSIQSGDSESFQSLLREIAIMPPEKRQVDDAKLAELLTSFRGEIMGTDFETEYLALLRKRILPESKSAAPLPNTELAGSKRSAGTSIRNRQSDWDDDDVGYEEPIVRTTTRRTLPSNDEPIVAQNSLSMAGPVYPNLPQLPNGTPAVAQASYQSQSVVPPVPNIVSHGAGDWQAPTRVAVEQLRYAIEQTPNGRTETNEIRLRMLEMLLGNKTEAAKPMQSADKIVDEFMRYQVLGFADILDDSMQNNRYRYDRAAYRFGEGYSELQKLCPVKLKKVIFVTDWFGYGQYVPHPTQEFYPGDTFYVYMEIENPATHRTTDSFEVSYAISYEIRDAHAKVVFRQEAKEQGERALSRKRDYYIPIDGTIPTSLAPGKYQLRINLMDLNDDSMQYAEEQIPFQVAPSLATGR